MQAQQATMVILVVDDEPDLELLMLQYFRQSLLDGHMRFHFARDGRQALALLDAHPDIDLMLSDINMPGMDGLTLLEHTAEKYPLLKSVMVSAYGDMDNIRAAMNRGAYDFVTKPVDFSDLEKTVNRTYAQVLRDRQTIQAVRENDILRMYVDADVLRFMTTSRFEDEVLQNELTRCTVAFIDICGFTALSEQMTPDAVVGFLNLHFDRIVTEVIREAGHIDKFMGDCVMAVFRGADHEYRAVRAALAVRRRFQDGAGERQPGVAIGINAGDMVSGNIGSRTYRRLDYTVIGDVVNTAKRLQSAAGRDQILITEEVYRAVARRVTGSALGPRLLRNKENPVDVFSVEQLTSV